MLAVKLTVPIARWRKGYARELLETEVLPPPATCYGALLSLVGEVDRRRHLGCRVSAAVCGPRKPPSQILRTLWRIKDLETPQGNGQNARPDFQQLLIQTTVMVFCDQGDEPTQQESLEARVRAAFEQPSKVSRFGGWSLGESTHLINDAWLLPDAQPDEPCDAFLLDSTGNLTLPVWVDHIGTAKTRYAVGRLTPLTAPPKPDSLPLILQ